MLMIVFYFYRISSFDPPPARVFAWRVLELKGQGVNEDEAMAVADVRTQLLKFSITFLANCNPLT